MKLLFLCCLLVCVEGLAQQTSLPAGTRDPDEPVTPPSTLSSAKPAGIAAALAAAEDKIEAHDYDAARPGLLGYLQQHPGDARARFDLGFVEDSTGQQDAAERDYQKAIAADPKQFESHAALGLLYAQTNRAQQGVAGAFRPRLSSNPPTMTRRPKRRYGAAWRRSSSPATPPLQNSRF